MRSLLLSSVLALGAAIPAALLATPAHAAENWSNDWQAKSEKEVDLAVPHVAGRPLSIETGNGSVSVRADRGAHEVSIHAKIRAKNDERLEQVRIRAERDGDGALVVEAVFPDGKRQSNEGCSFEIVVPEVNGFNAKTGNGKVSIEGLAGPAVIKTSNGQVVVRDHSGTVDANTSNGMVTLVNIAGSVRADTSNGKVNVEDCGGPVEVETSNGAVTISLRESASGPINVETSNGSVEVNVPAGYHGELAMTTSSWGKVNFTDVAGRTISERRSLEVALGDGGPRSTIKTSNGSITARVVEN